MLKDCDSYCGSENQICCSSGEQCTTLDNAAATCVPTGGSRHRRDAEYQVTTWTETRTYTSTIMTNWLAAPEPTEGVDCIPQADEQEPCGPICCAGWQTCAYNGQCSAKPGYDEPSTIVITKGGKTTTRYSAPYRITGTTVVVTTEAPKSETTTVTDNETSSSQTGDAAEATETDKDGNLVEDDGGSGGGLSAGAIAGIVIGVIAGVFLLMLLAFCCIARGCWNLIFGRKKDKEKRESVIYEESHYHGSRPPPKRHSGWFGFGGRDRPSSVGDRREKKDSSGKWWLGLAGAAATMLALLNLKKDKKPARKGGSRSRYSDSYYTYSDSSPSKLHRTADHSKLSSLTRFPQQAAQVLGVDEPTAHKGRDAVMARGLKLHATPGEPPVRPRV